MHKLILWLAIFLSWTYQASHARDLDFTREDGSKISLIWRHQTDHKAKTVLVILQGSDCNSVAHNPNITNVFPKVLPQADVLGIEKYGITPTLHYSDEIERADCPSAYYEHDSLDQRLKDGIKVLSQVWQTGWYDHMVLLGGSEGSMLATMLAARLDFVTATIALNHGGATFDSTIRHNITGTIPDGPDRQAALDGFEQFKAQILKGQQMQAPMSGHATSWWKSILKVNMLDELLKVNSPVYLMQALDDTNTSPEQAQILWQALRQNHKTNVTTKSYANMNHTFKDSDGNDKTDLVIADIQSWLGCVM